MEQRLQQLRDAGQRAVDFQLQYCQHDGSFIWDPQVRDAYHKQTLSWALACLLPQANRLVTWIRDNTLQPDGSLEAYRGDVYKLSWLFHGCHRIGRLDVSHPVIGFVLTQQAEAGGFPHFSGGDRLRALPTAWAAVAALSFGRPDVAERAARWCLTLLDQPEEGRYYYQTALDGSLITTKTDPNALFIDLNATEQPYWEIGLPWLLCCKLYQATGAAHWLQYAEEFFALHLRCAEDRFSHTGSGKSSLAAATHYTITRDRRARDAALSFCDYLLATQTDEGTWSVGGSDSLLTRIDAAAEFNVWLQEIAGLLGG